MSLVDAIRNGTQVSETDTKTNGTQIVYTVTSGKVLYVDSMWLVVLNESSSNSYGRLLIRDDGDTTVDVPIQLHAPKIDTDGVAGVAYGDRTFPLFYEILEDYDICVVSPAANVGVRGGIHGFEL